MSVVSASLLIVNGVNANWLLDSDDVWNVNSNYLSQMDQGGVGLLQTPTSRMNPKGELSINYRDNDQYRYWSVSLQLFPWLETTVRYSDIRTLLYSTDPNFSGDQTAKDKGIDAKIRLLQESYYIPELSVGVRDFGGNGFFEGEFLAASKRWGDLDFHLGMGWGYLGRSGNISNPFCDVADRFCDREPPQGPQEDTGGKIEFQSFFNGPAALFGGIEYQTPWRPLRLKVEYEGNDYSQERAGLNEIVQDSHWNFGANYRYKDFDFSLSYERGNTLMFGVTYNFNLHTIKQVKYEQGPVSLAKAKPVATVDEVDKAKLVSDLAYRGGFVTDEFDLTEDRATVYGVQRRYRDSAEAVERVGRLMATYLPETVDEYRLVQVSNNNPMIETVVDADEFISAAKYEGVEKDLTKTYHRQEPDADTRSNYQGREITGFFAGMETYWIQTFGNPEAFYLYEGGVYLTGGYLFNRNTSLIGSVKVSILDNFDKFNFTVDNQDTGIPRVRTLVREYVSKGNINADTLFLNWTDEIAKDWYGQVYGGYLETMYGGVGGEVLYRPIDSNLAYGFDLNWVKQRSFENDYAFRDYEAITGHANIYWTPDFLPDTQLTFNIGQFLAEDKGINIDFAKRFDSGIVVGAYAAFTDVSAEEYGEGSFTKGFYLSIPFDLFSLRYSKGRGKLPWIPISRDGGQPLRRPVKLHDVTELRAPFYDQ
ncbi:MAG: YjbH domain-containing protein [Aestuariibacter sp.]